MSRITVITDQGVTIENNFGCETTVMFKAVALILTDIRKNPKHYGSETPEELRTAAAALNLLEALKQLLSIGPFPFSDHNEIRDAKSVAREAIAQATNPGQLQNSIGQTRDAANVLDYATGNAYDSTQY